jgi:RNA-binding protein
MLNSKQRATLRGLANTIDTILQVGKADITENVRRQADDALTARELIKLRVQEGSTMTARDAAEQLAVMLRAEVVQVIGTRFVLYRPNHEKPVIKL